MVHWDELTIVRIHSIHVQEQMFLAQSLAPSGRVVTFFRRRLARAHRSQSEV